MERARNQEFMAVPRRSCRRCRPLCCSVRLVVLDFARRKPCRLGSPDCTFDVVSVFFSATLLHEGLVLIGVSCQSGRTKTCIRALCYSYTAITTPIPFSLPLPSIAQPHS